MRSLSHAKQRARALSALIGAGSEGLFEGIKDYLFKEHRIRVRAVEAHEINDNEAELSVFERELCYVKRLNADPVQRLLVVAHELGHLDLHKRLTDQLSGTTQLLPSIYLGRGAPALARYNSRAREEIEADAFAKEFVCSSGEIFEQWLRDQSATSKSLAAERGLPEDFVRVQLVEGLSDMALEHSPEVKDEPRRALLPDETQVAAATHVGTPALVNAGPGTGKTSTLVMRIEYLRREKGAQPRQMLVLTFSNEAADKLRERVAEKFDAETASEMEITTFHSFGYSFLLTHGHRIGLDPEITVLDEARQEELINGLLGRVDCDAIIDLKQPEETARQALRQICRLKERRVSPDKLEEAIDQWGVEEPEQKPVQERSRALLSIFREYERVKTGLNAVDFADLIVMPLDLLERDKELAASLRNHHKWVMIDEYQDVSRAVAMLLGELCSEDNPPWVVGDLRQAIYLFCGASRQNVSHFPEDFRGAKIFELETNYRSCDEVINVANQLAELMECPGKADDSYSERWRRGTDTKSLEADGGAVVVAQADSDDAEYEGIA
ncbi:MAG TPA: UvrD-helicase domain-containing protein, partial [Pyrinomonadaceae bacterium]